jgi:hypothetical protein
MAIQYELVREGRVLWQTYTDPVDMTEVATYIEKLHRELYDKATRPIHAISDFSAVTQLPKNIISGSLNIMRHSHPMNGELILITTNRFVTTMARIFRQSAAKQKISLCRTLDEAWERIDQLLEQEDVRV